MLFSWASVTLSPWTLGIRVDVRFCLLFSSNYFPKKSLCILTSLHGYITYWIELDNWTRKGVAQHYFYLLNTGMHKTSIRWRIFYYRYLSLYLTRSIFSQEIKVAVNFSISTKFRFISLEWQSNSIIPYFSFRILRTKTVATQIFTKLSLSAPCVNISYNKATRPQKSQC